MLHPLMTAELVRQRRAALAARNQRLVRPLRRARADPRARPATYDGTDIGVPRLPAGTWTIDPAHSSVSFAWRTLRRWTMTGRLQALGVINLDELPVVGVIRFQQPSGLPVLTMAWDPANVEAGDADLEAMGCDPDVVDAVGPRWTLHSESLEVLPSGAWRVMATLTADGTAGLVELHLEVDPRAGGHDWLVLWGRGMTDRRAFATGKWAARLDPTIQLELAVRARRMETYPNTGRQEGIATRRASVTAEEPARGGQRAS